MAAAFYKIINQVVVLFLLMGLGYGATKLKMLSDAAIKELTALLMYIVAPIVIVHAFQIQFSSKLASELLISVCAAVGIHIFGSIASRLIFNKKSVPDLSRKNALRFGSIYSNSGFMGLPLLDAVAGQQGVFFGSVYMAVFNIFCWTEGVTHFNINGCKTSRKEAVKKVLLNPNVIGIFVGLFFFFFSIKMPGPIGDGMTYIYNINTPLSMIIIGSRLAKFKLPSMFTEKWVWPGIAMRNLAIPMVLITVLHLLGLRNMLLLSCSLSAACPVAANTVLFAELSGEDTEFPTKLMTVSTLMSIVTIPIIVFYGTMILK